VLPAPVPLDAVRLARGLLLTAVLTLAGCGADAPGLFGYRHEELYPADVRTIAVPILDNRTFERGTELGLTEALIKEIELRTPYKVTDPEAADTMLTGSVRSVDRRVLSRTLDSAIPQEMQVVVTADFEWKDLRTGDVIRRRGSIQGTGEYVPTRAVGEPFETARREAVAELARDIVSLMRADW